jgi:hypothetical protein
MVSCTLTFQEHEKGQLPALMAAKSGQLKTMSFLPTGEVGAYKQMPYERIDVATRDLMRQDLGRINWDSIYDGGGVEAEGEKYCTTDFCEVPG